MSELPQDTRVALGEILGTQKHLVKTMDNMSGSFAEFRREIRDEQNNINKRLTVLEQFQWKLIGMAAASGIVLPVLTSLCVWWLTKNG